VQNYSRDVAAVSDFTRLWDNLFKSRPSGFRLGKCNAIVIPTCNIAAAGFACERTELEARTRSLGSTSPLGIRTINQTAMRLKDCYFAACNRIFK